MAVDLDLAGYKLMFLLIRCGQLMKKYVRYDAGTRPGHGEREREGGYGGNHLLAV